MVRVVKMMVMSRANRSTPFSPEMIDTSLEIDLGQFPWLESYILNPKLGKVKRRSIWAALINFQLFRRWT